MTDLISRADAIGTVLTYFIPRSHTGERGEHEEDFVRMIFKELPSTDAVQVVRCKDCKHYIVEGIATQYGWCHEYKHSVDEDDYCSYGERKK